MKKILSFYIKTPLILRIAIGLVIGICFGLFLPKATFIAVFGSVFVGALKAIAPVLVFILVIASLVQMVELLLKKFAPALHKGLGVYLPLITTNCAVLGVAINNITDGYNFVESMVSSLGCGLGFLLAMVLFSGIRSRIDESKVPVYFRGLAFTLIAASFVSLAFMGFAGRVDSLFA